MMAVHIHVHDGGPGSGPQKGGGSNEVSEAHKLGEHHGSRGLIGQSPHQRSSGLPETAESVTRRKALHKAYMEGHERGLLRFNTTNPQKNFRTTTGPTSTRNPTMFHGRDTGTPEGARKAAQTRKQHGGGPQAQHEKIAKEHESLAGSLERSGGAASSVYARQHRSAAAMHREAASYHKAGSKEAGARSRVAHAKTKELYGLGKKAPKEHWE